MDRRQFLKLGLLTAVSSTLPLLGCQAPVTKPALSSASGRALRRANVVVVGAGFAGASVAKYLSLWSQGALNVTLIEPQAQFISCPLSNLVLSGGKTLADLSFSYRRLQQADGLRWVSDSVQAIDAQAKRVSTQHHQFAYDKLILAPGITLQHDHLPGYSQAVANQAMPHAWKAGAQTTLLTKQLQAMRPGGVLVLTIPQAPYRCPPGPYERVCQMAFYLQQHNPSAKIIVLDANPDIVSKKALFNQVWQNDYPQLIDYRPNSQLTHVDAANKTCFTEFDRVQADVCNLIPRQRAGHLAHMAGLLTAQQDWVEVNFLNYASRQQPDIHVIGDAIASHLPKSAHMANAQAKVCAAAILAELQQQAPDPQPVFANTCYSFVDHQRAIHVAHLYRYDAEKAMMIAAAGGGVSPQPSKLEGDYAYAWASQIWGDVLS